MDERLHRVSNAAGAAAAVQSEGSELSSIDSGTFTELPSADLRGYVLTMSFPVRTFSNQSHVSDQSSTLCRTPAGNSLITFTYQSCPGQ